MPTGKQPKFCYTRTNSPYWQYEFVIDGERYRGSTGHTEAKDAASFVEELRVKIRAENQAMRDRLPNIRNGKRQITLGDALAKFEEQRAKHTKTFKDQKRYAEYLLNLAEGGSTLLRDITPEHFMDYRTRRRMMHTRTKDADGNPTFVKDSTINREISHARNVWNHVKFLKYDVGDPIKWGLLMPTEDEGLRTRELSADEEANLFKALERVFPDVIPLVRFTLLTAVRKSAAVNLLWANVDLVSRQAVIISKSRKKEKRHTIPLTQKLVDLIDAQPRSCPEVFTFEAKKTKVYHGGKLREKGKRYPFTVDGINERWYKALEEAGIADFRFHDLRHTGASRIVRHSRSLPVAQKLLDHSDINTTMRYAHVLQDDVLNAMEEVDTKQDLMGKKKNPHTRTPHVRSAA